MVLETVATETLFQEKQKRIWIYFYLFACFHAFLIILFCFVFVLSALWSCFTWCKLCSGAFATEKGGGEASGSYEAFYWWVLQGQIWHPNCSRPYMHFTYYLPYNASQFSLLPKSCGPLTEGKPSSHLPDSWALHLTVLELMLPLMPLPTTQMVTAGKQLPIGQDLLEIYILA